MTGIPLPSHAAGTGTPRPQIVLGHEVSANADFLVELAAGL
ncbi:hypothetical protein [Streptomyces sp. NPDC006134]